MYRKPILDIVARTGLTQLAYDLLRKEKRKQHKSITEIINNLIVEKYASDNEVRRVPEKVPNSTNGTISNRKRRAGYFVQKVLDKTGNGKD